MYSLFRISVRQTNEHINTCRPGKSLHAGRSRSAEFDLHNFKGCRTYDVRLKSILGTHKSNV